VRVGEGGVVVVIVILSYIRLEKLERGGGWNVIFPVYAIAGVFLIVL